jgi:hypothetical protein
MGRTLYKGVCRPLYIQVGQTLIIKVGRSLCVGLGRPRVRVGQCASGSVHFVRVGQ